MNMKVFAILSGLFATSVVAGVMQNANGQPDNQVVKREAALEPCCGFKCYKVSD